LDLSLLLPAACTVVIGVAGCGGATTEPSSEASPHLATKTSAIATTAGSASVAYATKPKRATPPTAGANTPVTVAAKHVARTRPTPTPHAELTSFESRTNLALTTFNQRVYRPFKTHRLNGKAALTEAGAAAMATLREVLQAKQQATGGTAVRELFAPLAALSATLKPLATNLRRGRPDPSDIQAANGAIAGIERQAAASGLKIR
jgi:hypothetical protein